MQWWYYLSSYLGNLELDLIRLILSFSCLFFAFCSEICLDFRVGVSLFCFAKLHGSQCHQHFIWRQYQKARHFYKSKSKILFSSLKRSSFLVTSRHGMGWNWDLVDISMFCFGNLVGVSHTLTEFRRRMSELRDWFRRSGVPSRPGGASPCNARSWTTENTTATTILIIFGCSVDLRKLELL